MRSIDSLLVDQHRIDDAAHLHELLPVPAVAGKARDLTGGHGSHLAEANLGDHTVKSSAGYAACRGAPEVVVDRLDLRPTERHKAIPHGAILRHKGRAVTTAGPAATLLEKDGILQGTALSIVQNLMGRRLAHIEDRLLLQMMRPDLVRCHGAASSDSG